MSAELDLGAGDPARAGSCSAASQRCAGPARRRSASPRTRNDDRAAVDAVEAAARALVAAMAGRRLGPGRPSTRSTTTPTSPPILRFAATEVVPRLAEHDRRDRADPARARRRLHRGRAVGLAAARSGQRAARPGATSTRSTRRAVPSRLAWETGVAMADSLLGALPRTTTGDWPRSVGLSVWGTSGDAHRRRRHRRSACAAGCSADLGRGVAAGGGPRADPAGRARPSAHRRDRAHLRLLPRRVPARGRRCSTTRCSWSPTSTSPPSDNYVRAHAQADLAEHGDQRRATTRIFGSKPGTYGAGLLQLIDSRQLARRRRPRRGLHRVGRLRLRPRPRRRARRRRHERGNYRRIAVAAKNTDTREHDIADSDDYFQYHGGMVATVRALTGQAPGRVHRRHRPGPTPCAPARCRRRRPGSSGPASSNPRWIDAMRRHGYKGAFETGRDRRLPVRLRRHRRRGGTTGCTSSSRRSTCSTTSNRKFMAESNPWALHGMAERLLEAAGRGDVGAARSQATLDGLRAVLLETEGEPRRLSRYVERACHLCRRRQVRMTSC